MSSKILKNNTGSAVPIADTGDTVPASGQLTIVPQDYGKYEGSSDVIVVIGDGTLTVNDGVNDLSITEGTRLIQGGFSRPVSDGVDPTIKATVLAALADSINLLATASHIRGGRTAYEIMDVDDIDGVKRARVDAIITGSDLPPGSTGTIPTLDSNFRYEDMNASTGGVARSTSIDGTFVTLYSVTGSGFLLGFRVGLSSLGNDWFLRLIVDGNDIFGATGLSMADVTAGAIYALPDKGQISVGFRISGDNFIWHPPHDNAMKYESTIEIQARKDGGLKPFVAGYVARTL